MNNQLMIMIKKGRIATKLAQISPRSLIPHMVDRKYLVHLDIHPNYDWVDHRI